MYVSKWNSFVLTINCILSMIECDSPPVFDPKADALRILQDKHRDKVLLEILHFRTFTQCVKIHKEFIAINGGKPLVDDIKTYVYEETSKGVAKNILFCKIMGVQALQMVFLWQALYPYGNSYRSESPSAIDLLIIEDANRPSFVQAFDQSGGYNVRELLERYDGDFGNFVLQLQKRNRMADAEPNDEEVKEFVNKLNEERKENAWENKRDILDTLLIETPLKFVRAALIEYFNQNRNQLRDDIPKKRKDDNDDLLILAYRTLIDFAADEYSLYAKIIHENVSDSWLTWEQDDVVPNRKTFAICVILCNAENGAMSKINDKFIEKYKTSIKEYILSCDSDGFYNKLLAAVVQNSIENEYPPEK